MKDQNTKTSTSRSKKPRLKYKENNTIQSMVDAMLLRTNYTKQYQNEA